MRQKGYLAHELAYRKMERDGIAAWNERLGGPAIDRDLLRFLRDAFAQPYMPREGRALEIGCGTAPILRWVAARGFRATGIDASPTAIRMAKRQSRGVRGIDLRVGDATHLRGVADGSIDVVVDGNCLHCIVGDRDREAVQREIARVLRPGGCFVVLSMARPLRSSRRIGERPGFVRENVMFQPIDGAQAVRGAVRVDGVWYAPTRRFEHWRAMLRMLERHGLEPRLVRLALASADEPLSHLAAVAVRS